MNRCLQILLPLALVSFSFAQTTNGKLSGINASDLKRLRATRLRFVVPTEVPLGYKVQSVALEKPKDGFLTTLEIIYSHGKGQIIVEECSEGIGDVLFEDDADPKKPQGSYRLASPIFGRQVRLDYQTAHGQSQWLVNWQKAPGKKYPQFISATGRGSSVREGVKLFKSLRYLK